MSYMQVDWNHYLNNNLTSWYLASGGEMCGAGWRDLCGRHDGDLTSLDPVTCWIPATRQGHRGSILTNGSGYVAISNGNALNNAQTATISMWVRWNGTQDAGTFSNNGAVIGRQHPAAAFSNHVVSLNGTNPDTAKIRLALYIGNVWQLTSATSPGDGVWRHICISYTSGAQRMWIDGVLDATGTGTGTVASDVTVPLTIGGWTGAGASFSTADIDCVRFLAERFFTDEEAADEYQHTANYCRGLLKARRRHRFKGQSFNPAWARGSNVLLGAGGVL